MRPVIVGRWPSSFTIRPARRQWSPHRGIDAESAAWARGDGVRLGCCRGPGEPGPRPGRGDAERHGRRPARAHQGPGVRRVRGPRAGHAGRREDGRVSDRAVPQARPEARQPRRHVRPERAARRLPGPVGRGGVPGRRRHDRPEVPGRLGRRLPEPGAGGEGRELRGGLRRLRRRRARVRLGRFQGGRRARQDGRHAGQRPGRPRPQGPECARPRHVPREGDDLLRALDVQVRDRLGEGGGRRDPRPRDGAGGLSLFGRRRQLGAGELRHRRTRRRRTGPGRGRGVGEPGDRQEALRRRRPGFRRPQEGRQRARISGPSR